MFHLNSSSTATGRAPGQGLLEYALIISLVAIVAMAGLLVFGPAVVAMFPSFAGIF